MYYTESGKIDPTRTILFGMLVILLLIGLSYIYNLLNNFIPILYANIFITIGYGMFIGILVKAWSYFGKVRNRRIVVLGALLFGLVANYTQWVDFIVTVYNDFNNSFSDYLSALLGGWSIGDLLYAVTEINEYGTWALGFSSDLNVNGTLLGIVWIAEFLLILGLPLYMAFFQKVHPFAEDHNRFYERFVLNEKFIAIHSGKPIIEDLSQKPLEFIENLNSGLPSLYSNFIMYYLPNAKFSYLDVEKVTIEARGKGKTRVTEIIDNLQIEAAQAKMILQKYEHTSGGISRFAGILGLRND